MPHSASNKSMSEDVGKIVAIKSTIDNKDALQITLKKNNPIKQCFSFLLRPVITYSDFRYFIKKSLVSLYIVKYTSQKFTCNDKFLLCD